MAAGWVSLTTELEHRLKVHGGPVARLLPAPGYEGYARLPGQRVRIGENSTDDLLQYLRDSNLTPKLDKLYPKLWLVSKPCSSHIRSLLHQPTRGRDRIIVVNNPDLHLVWSWHRVFIRAIPRYMLSIDFWKFIYSQTHSETERDIYRACAGFMRTYYHLIESEADFEMATRGDPPFLIPTKDDKGEIITYERWVEFIEPFGRLSDNDVSPRYRYGELRLTRLNHCARLFLGELTFHHIDGQWGSYLQRCLTPLLSVFAILSIILNAMQVGLAVESLDKAPHYPVTFSYVSWWFSILTVGFAASGVFCIFELVLFMCFHDVWYARRSLHRQMVKAEQGHEENEKTFNTGVVKT